MAGTNYPGKIDTDAELPRVDDNVSEIGSETLNAMREAIVGIQRALGTDPQGSAADLKTRLERSLNDDGTLKTAALIITGITNAEIAASAAIEESKLDLDVGTQDLQDQVTSNDIDIAELQRSLAKLIQNFNLHVAGAALQHDSFDILLDDTSPTTTPPAFVSLTAVNVGDAIIEMNNRFLTHAAADTDGAHNATNVSVDPSNFTLIPMSATDVQLALEALDLLRATEFIRHRDHLHANGFDNWANNVAGYNENLQKVPSGFGNTTQALLVPGFRNRIRFTGISLATQLVEQGDIIVIGDGYAAGNYIIDDVGPRNATLGTKPILGSDEAEITGTFRDGYLIPDGYVDAQIFGPSSQFSFKTNVATTFHQSGATLDSVQVSRPNSAKVLSLGVRPDLVDGTESLDLEVGIGNGNVRTISIPDLDEDRSGPVSDVTIDTIVDRINSVLQGADNFPAAAYRVGDELMLSHNWDGYQGYYIKVDSSSTAGLVLGFDGYGADILDREVPPTMTSKYYVNGYELSNFRQILRTSDTSISGSTITFTNLNPLALGVRVGHTIHVFDHDTVSANGTYFITAVSSTSVTVHTGIPALTQVDVEIRHDTAPLADFVNSTDSILFETFLDSDGRMGSNARLIYDKTIANLNITDISDNFIPGDFVFTSTAVSGGHNLKWGSVGVEVFVPTGFIGQKTVYADSNIESIVVDISGPLSASVAAVTVNEHINEEEVLEISIVRSNGLETLFDVRDKRLFGSIGQDELREDVIQLYIESPLAELRSNGVVRGLDIIQENFTDFSYPTNQSVLIRGGTLYVDGVRCDVRTISVVFPNVAGTYFIVLNKIGTYQIINETDYTLDEILEGAVGEVAVIAKAVHDGSDITSSEDLRFFINNIDDALDAVVDATNNFIGNYATFEAALNAANSYPDAEKPIIRIVSNEPIDIEVSSGSREVTVQLDGYVNNVTVAASCKIESRTVGVRSTDSHIVGTLTATSDCSRLELDNISVDGATSLSVSSNSVLMMRGLKFNSSFISSVVSFDRLIVESCEFDDSCIFASSGGSEVSISKCLFRDNTFLALTSPDGLSLTECIFDEGNLTLSNVDNVLASNCTWLNHSGTAVPVLFSVGRTATFQSCAFKDISLTAGTDLISETAGTSTRAVFNGCHWEDVTLSGTSQLFNLIEGQIRNSIFRDNTYTTDVGITCQTFQGNIRESGTGEILVQAEESFIGNLEFHAVQGPQSPSTDNLKTISGNKFARTSTFGYNVDLAVPASIANPETSIMNNYFDMLTGQEAIVCGTNTRRAKIIGNHFDSVGGSGSTGIAVNNAGVATSDSAQILIQSNTFRNTRSITTTDAVEGLHIIGNRLGAIDDSIQMGDDFVFSYNTKVDGGDVTLSGSGVDNARIHNNNLETGGGIGVLDITCPLTESSIVGNVAGRMDLSASLTDSIVSSNTCAMGSPNVVSFTRVIYTENIQGFTTFDTANITWEQSIISENYFAGIADNTFTVASTISNDPAYVMIANNIFTRDIEITATNDIDKIWVANNFSSLTSPEIRFASALNDSLITSNIDFALDLQSGANSCVFANNVLKDADIDLAGTVNSTTFNGNFCNNFNVNCRSDTSLNLLNNTVFGNLDVFTVSGNLDITSANFSNNTITSSLRIGSGVGNFDTQEFKDSTISSNIMQTLSVFESGDTTAIFDFSSNTISGNTAVNFNFIGEAATEGYDRNDFNLTDNTLSANNVSTAVSLRGGGNTGVLYTNFTLSANNITTLNLFDNFSYSGFIINSNIIGTLNIDIDRTSSTTTVMDNLVISGNLIETDAGMNLDDGTMTVNQMSVTGNIMNGIDFQIENTAGGGDFADVDLINISFINNFMRSVRLDNDGGTTASTFDGYGIVISNNSFSGTSGGANEPGIFITKDNKNSDSLFSSIVMTGNYVPVGLGNLPDTQIVFESTGGSGDMTLQNIEMSGNKSIDMILDFTSPSNVFVNGMVIGNNIWANDTANPVGFRLAGTSTLSTLSNSQFFANTGEEASITLDGFTTATALNINGNFLSDTGEISLAIDDGIAFLIIANNRVGTIDIDGQAGTDSTLVGAVITGNAVLEIILNDLDDTGLFSAGVLDVAIANNRIVDNLTIDGILGDVAGLSITGNTAILGDFDLIGIGDDLVSFNISNNIIGGFSGGDLNITVTDEVGDGVINSNVCDDVIITSDDMDDVVVSSNHCGQIDISGVTTQIERCIFSSNVITGSFDLPTIGTFLSGARQTKICFNSAGSWTAPAAFATAGTANVFVWGNTQNGTSTNVDFTGVTATNTGTANDVTSGGVGTGITC